MTVALPTVRVSVLLMWLVVPVHGQEVAAIPAEATDDPPDVVCATLPEDRRRTTEACTTDAERREDDQERRRREAERAERRPRSSFLKWVHLDTMWVPTVLGSSTIGLVGGHIAVANIGRIHLYGPPGVMLLLRNTSEGRAVRPALTWGISIYLTDFRMPGVSQNAQVYLNFAKCWMSGDQRASMDMGGLSITWKK
jgi:hypothetical protein